MHFSNIMADFMLLLVILPAISCQGSCSDWKLSGGSNWYEGIVEVLYNQTWANICADSFNESDAWEVCTRIFDGKGFLNKQYPYESNVYGAVLQNSSIFYNMCGKGGSKQSSRCNNVASLCCYDSSKESCSSNWTSTVKAGSDFRRKYKLHLQYDELLRVNFTNMNIIKSWTKSALEEQKCEKSLSTNDNVIEVARNCSSTCLVTSDLIFIMFSEDNKTCCLRNSSSQTLQSEDCTIRNLSIVNGIITSETPRFCLAAEVINGSLYISIEDCGRFFKAFNVSRNMVRPPTPPPPPPKTTTTTTTTKENTSSIQSNGQSTTHVKTVKTTEVMKTQTGISVTASLTIAVSSVVVVVIMVFVVIVVLIKMRRENRGAHQTRVQYVPEHTSYITPISDETGDGAYATVQDIDTSGGNDGYENPNPQRNVYHSLRESRVEEHGYGASGQATGGLYQPMKEERIDAHNFEIAEQSTEVPYDSLGDTTEDTRNYETSNQTTNVAAYDWVE